MQADSPKEGLFLTVQLLENAGDKFTCPLFDLFRCVLGFDTLSSYMTDQKKVRLFRFGVFEADAATGELRRQGIRIKVNVQPFQVLLMLLERPGQVLTREEISRELWPDGTFVDYEHGVNSAVNRIREALGDKANAPRFIETLARRGYRFVAPVERVEGNEDPSFIAPSPAVAEGPKEEPAEPEAKRRFRFLATQNELPKASYRTVQTLFVPLQLMYLGFYVGALANLAEIEDLFNALPRPAETLLALIVTAALLIPVRVFLLCAVLFHAPGLRPKFLKMWPFVLPFDVLWSLSPFLLLHHISVGLALACMAPLVYSPFAQRSLMLMGAGESGRD
jgi:cholera toxin transcriptional activator